MGSRPVAVGETLFLAEKETFVHENTSCNSSHSQGVIAIDEKKCKGCDACKRHCPSGAICGSFGSKHSIDPDICLSCGQCLLNCPFRAPFETTDAVSAVLEKVDDPTCTVVGIIAPAVRVAIGEEFGMPAGTLVTGKLYAALHKIGMRIFDNNFAADLTIMEEGSEFIDRLRYALFNEHPEHSVPGPLPQFTSCCPAWVTFVELFYPRLIPHLSTAKSPQQMAGAVVKTYGALKVFKTPPESIFTVGIMPCTAKKFEARRSEFTAAYGYNKQRGISSGPPYSDIDAVLTTRDLARLLKKKGINLTELHDTAADSLFGEYSGAGTIFGNTGGVMEAAVRTAYAVLTGEELQPLDFLPVRGLKGVKSASIGLRDVKHDANITLSVAVVHNMRENIRPLLEDVLAGRSPYHFIEVMNCPGGCINGGGQPIIGEGTSWIGRLLPVFSW